MAADTIFALSSGAPPAGIAVVRLSGPGTRFALETLCGRPVPPPRIARVARLRSDDGESIDQALVLWMPGPNSFTGEDVGELHCHGGRAVVARILSELSHLPGLRPAEAGDFTRAAFLNGRLDLPEVEALGDLIAAETEAQRRAAMGAAEHGWSRRAEGWRDRLLRAQAWVEAEIDFSDESDVPEGAANSAWADVEAMSAEIEEILLRARPAERLRQGLTVVLVGAPNSGKSSLFNALVGRAAAIVSPEAGTTRDLIEIDLDIAGYPVRLIDTAGLRDADTAVEAEGIRRARARAAEADLVLALNAPDAPLDPAEVDRFGSVSIWRLATKADLATCEPAESVIAVSIHRPSLLDALTQRLADFARETLIPGRDGLLLLARQRAALADCAENLRQASSIRVRIDLAGEHLRRAAAALARLTGRLHTEDVLDIVFRQFCIGK